MIKKVTLYPSRIGCPSLPGTMKGVIISIAGIKEVDVHYEERALDITFDDSLVSVEEMTKKIGNEVGIAMMEKGKVTNGGEGAGETCPM